MDDLISRKAVLACEQHIWTDCGVVSVEDIKELPPVIPKQRWIPVSERLPEPQDDADKDYSDTVQVTVHVCRNTDIVRDAYYCFSKGKWYIEGFCIGTVTAWMPLPEAYKGEGEKHGSDN